MQALTFSECEMYRITNFNTVQAFT